MAALEVAEARLVESGRPSVMPRLREASRRKAARPLSGQIPRFARNDKERVRSLMTRRSSVVVLGRPHFRPPVSRGRGLTRISHQAPVRTGQQACHSEPVEEPFKGVTDAMEDTVSPGPVPCKVLRQAQHDKRGAGLTHRSAARWKVRANHPGRRTCAAPHTSRGRSCRAHSLGPSVALSASGQRRDGSRRPAGPIASSCNRRATRGGHRGLDAEESVPPPAILLPGPLALPHSLASIPLPLFLCPGRRVLPEKHDSGNMRRTGRGNCTRRRKKGLTARPSKC